MLQANERVNKPWSARKFAEILLDFCEVLLFLAAVIVLATMVGGAEAQAAAPAPKILADFADAGSLALKPQQAQSAIVGADGGKSLQITTDAKADYPSVQIEPKSGPWDLNAFDAVQMDIRNPQDVAVRILLSVNNPGANGREHCNVDSVSIAPQAKGTLTVPFGQWHGDPGHNLDLKNIASVQVLLDRPGRSHTFDVSNIRAVSLGAGLTEKVLNDPFYTSLMPAFGRGVNLGNALDAPNEGEWGVTLKESYFTAIGKAGFDSVRIPVRWSAHAEQAPPYAIDPKFFDRVDWTVAQSRKNHLRPIVNLHHYIELMQEPAKHRERFLGLWKQIAEHYKDEPADLAIELLNEPQDKMTPDVWNKLLAEAITVVRRSNPRREIVVGPVNWNSITALSSLTLPADDRRLVVTVHCYDPFHFTHQGADFAGPEAQKWLGTKWTGDPAEARMLRRSLDAAITWAVEHRRPLYLGEFGSYEKADLESRARWTQFMTQEALKRKIGIAYWEFCSSFGVFDPKKDEWIEPLRAALLAPVDSGK